MLKTPQRIAHLSRTGFDMGQKFAFTASVGMILPVYQDVINVGETVYLDGALLGRCQPLVTQSVADIDFFLDWFFVPTSLLYSLFPSVRYQTNDYFSSSFWYSVENNGIGLPLCDIDSLVSRTSTTYNYSNSGSLVYSIGGLNSKFDCFGKSTFRLLNHLGFNPYAIFKGDTSASLDYQTAQNPNVFPLFPMAYQAIFQDFFRLDDFEKRNVLSFNCDRYHNLLAAETWSVVDGLFQLRYRPRNKDYFTSVRPSALLSSVNLLADRTLSAGEILQKVDSFVDTRAVYTSQPDGTSQRFISVNNPTITQLVNNINASSSVTSTRVSTGQIRSLFAVEKLLRVIGRAKKDYDSQVLAHFGFRVPHDVKHEITHLFQQHNMMHIGPVVSAADTYDGHDETGKALGQIGGNGFVTISSRKKAYKFTAPVDGVVMCVFSAAPRYRYYNTFDKQNSITSRLDFFTPEFDKLGAQPLYAYETSFLKIGSSDRVGWQYRYAQHKQKYDRVSEAFQIPQNETNIYSAWVLGVKPFVDFNYSASGYSNFNLSNFYCSPKDIDQLLYVNYDTGWKTSYLSSPWLMFNTDPFIIDFAANVKKVSTMSPTGEPEL